MQGRKQSPVPIEPEGTALSYVLCMYHASIHVEDDFVDLGIDQQIPQPQSQLTFRCSNILYASGASSSFIFFPTKNLI
jgi:hypothetical protein